MTQHQGKSTSTHAAGSMTGGGTSTGTGGQGSTGVQDNTYNVISVVYHTLQGADTIQKYMQDARGSDQQVEQFLAEAAEQYKRLAQRGRECLAQMLQAQGQGGSGQQMQGGSSGGQQGTGGRSGQQSQPGGSSRNSQGS